MKIDRFHLAGDVCRPRTLLRLISGHFKQFVRDHLVEHKHYIREHGDDLPAVRDWTWPYSTVAE